MLNSKYSLQLKLLLRLVNSCFYTNSFSGMVLGKYYQDFILSNNIVLKLTLKLIRFVNRFMSQKKHLLLIFSENISPYFLLQVFALIVKNSLRISFCQQKYWVSGVLVNNSGFLAPSKKQSSNNNFQLLTGFNSKPDLVLLFGVTNLFVLREFTCANLPVILFCINTINFWQESYFVPKINTFLFEDFIFIFVVKYSFFHK
jgi:hypothetical protein